MVVLQLLPQVDTSQVGLGQLCQSLFRLLLVAVVIVTFHGAAQSFLTTRPECSGSCELPAELET